MTTNEGTIDTVPYKDRKIGLAIFGAVQIALGALCALMVPLMAMAMLAATLVEKETAPAMNGASLVPALLFYALLATWFIWMGIGSVMARRWARALLVVTSWLWLISGALGLLFMLVLMPDMFEQMSKSGQMPANAVKAVQYAVLGFMTIFYIILPGAFVLFYGSRHTKATCEHRDPVIRWTDRCPLPVLALTLMAGCGAACTPLMGLYGWALPCFGFIVDGAAGAAVALALTALLAYMARGLYRLQLRAWWCAVALVVAWGLSCGITFARIPLMDYYQKMHFPPQQLELMSQMKLPSGFAIALLCGLWALLALAFLLYTKRFFNRD